MKPQLSIGCNKLIMVPAFLVLIIAGCEYIHPNKPPYAEKILPVESAFFIGQTILFQVNAYDEDGTIDGVVFTPPNSSPFIDKTAPYEYSWPTTGMTVGVYKVEIKAVDNKNEPYIIEVPITLHGISAGKDTTFTDSTKTYVLDARLPENAQGTWTIISGTGGHIDETEIHNRNATLYGISCETFTLRWTVSLGTIEIYDDVTITFFHQPSQANAGPDQSYTDARISTKLQANDPIDGVGLWTIFSGGDGSFSNQVKPDATFTGLPSTTYKLIWNITTVCATSADTVEITFSHGAINANAGPDQFYTDSRTTATLAAESPTTGTWSIISGTGGAISDIHDPKATLTGISCQTYILRWPVSSGAPQDYDEVTIVFSYQPSKANAGVDQSINDGRTSTVLQANTPANGTGHWTIIAGLNGQFTNVSDPQAVFTGQPCQSYTLRWTIATPCSSNSDDMTIALNHDPSAASAGPDQVFNDGRNRATLAGNIPAVGTGIWTIISGTSGEFADASDPKSVFTGLICQDYILRWTISTACGSKYDEVQITFGYLASEADAGADQHLTDGSNFTQLRATPPVNGSGVWTIISGGTGSFSDTGDPYAIFTGVLCQSYVLRWTVSTGCNSSFDEVTVGFNQVDVIADAGPDARIPDGSVTTVMQGNTPGAGTTGTWSILTGLGGDFQDIHNPNTLFTGISGQVYTLKWTLSGGCLENSDMVFIAFISNGDMTDSRDSKTYRTVVIGNQEWMAENLNYLANGSYTYSGNIENASIYGRLYNWNSAKSACPSGWHLPTDAEWRQFEGFLGMDESTTLLEWYRGLNEGGMLKEQGTLYWRTPNTGATDITGFTARPGGYRSPTGIFGGIYTQAGFWTSTENVNGKAIYRALHNFKSQIGRDWYDQGYGFSVRCVKN